MNNELPLVELGVFATVAEAQGFSAAARRLGVSKAMVSTAVARLETKLGVRLFQRTTRRLSLTEDGAAALPHAQRALQAAQDAEDAATQSRATPRGTLKVIAPMSFGLLHIVPRLGEFARAFPDVNVDLVLDDRVVDLVAGAFDVGVRIGVLADSGLIAVRIGRNRSALVAHASYLARAGTPKKPADLVGHSALCYSLGASDWVLCRGRRSETVKLRPTLQANSSLALQHAALQGLGIARLPMFVAGDDLVTRRLVRVLPDWQLPETPIHLVTPSREHMPRKTRAFMEFFRSRMTDPPAWEQAKPARRSTR